MNTIIISGRLTKDITTFEGKGGETGAFTLANEVGYGDFKHTNFIQCYVSGNALKRMQAAHVHKGVCIFVNGRLSVTSKQTEDADGKKSYSSRYGVSVLDWEFPMSNRRKEQPGGTADSTADSTADGDAVPAEPAGDAAANDDTFGSDSYADPSGINWDELGEPPF